MNGPTQLSGIARSIGVALLMVLLGSCGRAPFYSEATGVLAAGEEMELVQSFAVPEGYFLGFRGSAADRTFFPTLRPSGPQFGLFVQTEGAQLVLQYTDRVVSVDTGELEDISPVGDRFYRPNSDIDGTGLFLQQRPGPFDPEAGELFVSYVVRDRDVDLEVLLVDPDGDPDVSLVEAHGRGPVYQILGSLAEFDSAEPVGVAVGVRTGGGEFPTPTAVALFEDEGQWRIVEQEISDFPGDPFDEPPSVRVELDSPAPQIPSSPDADAGTTAPYRPGVVFLREATGTDPATYVFVSIPHDGDRLTFRQRTPAGALEAGTYENINIDNPIVSVLSSNHLLVRAGSRYHAYDFDGNRNASIYAGPLRFVHERPVGGRWYSYFSGSYWGRLRGTDYLFFRVYRIETPGF